MNLHEAYGTRNRVMARLEEDLLGGLCDDELAERPLDRFVVGVLHPEVEQHGGSEVFEDTIERSEEVTTADGPANAPDIDGADDPVVAMSRVRYPRSMGLTFTVPAQGKDPLRIEVSCARYLQETGVDGPIWKRRQFSFDTIVLDPQCPGQFTSKLTVAGEPTSGLEFRTVVRDSLEEVIHVTVALVNTFVAAHGEKDGFAWFAPKISMKRQSELPFVARAEPELVGLSDPEQETQRLLFRDVKAFGVGHGVAVEWNDAATHLWTSFIPKYELLLSEAAGADSRNLGMVYLAKSTDFGSLDGLIADYRRWISRLSFDNLDDAETDALRANVRDAETAANRMERGLTLLRNDPIARRAFQLMNLAMAEQRSRQAYHRAHNIGDPPLESFEEAGWRPFQIAFILLNLEGMIDPSSPDREVADLLWFPTGGGKTEAYLGLVGIAILTRRLRSPEHGGVSVLMRYTLRLLTLQQYERATGLICALEKQRLSAIPDSQPISIGLWVGQASTPNTLDAARTALNRKRGHTAAADGVVQADPVQLRKCPWCGSELNASNYFIDRQMLVKCGWAKCAFREGLPVHIVDEDVFRERPSLVIGTVDKFALMAWKREVGNLFGFEGSTAEGHSDPPPDLIVQDELHLISGPLGTIVGLYETAIDSACSKPYRPKLVASTATIRRASHQVQAVFDRKSAQFPPAGRSRSDSFFSVEAPRDRKGSRQYVGILGSGTSQTTLMVRVYASLLQSGAAEPADSETADLYWTLLGYFNSLRILGGAYIQVLDDVPLEMEVIAQRRGEEKRVIASPREMTSRKNSSEIPAELKLLGTPRGNVDSPDVVLATNMISVGVDVDRLGLMAVMGQPQTTSEYIQATSRVGRSGPGLVVTIFNSARTRDLSHYENFVGYHQGLYRHVEATGATPFAPRARDRALHGVLVSMARMTVPAAAPDAGAGTAAEWKKELQHVAMQITARAERLWLLGGQQSPDESPQEVERELRGLVRDWVRSAETQSVDHYPGWFDKRLHALIVPAGSFGGRTEENTFTEDAEAIPPWETLTSMRDVDAESTLYFVRGRRRERG